MPVIAATAATRGAETVSRRIPRGQALVIVLAVGVALGLVWTAMRKAPQGGLKVPARSTEDVPAFTPPPGTPVVGVYQHLGGVVFTPHRYPHVCGGEISAIIHHGHAPMRIPHQRDSEWLMRPPSEVTL